MSEWETFCDECYYHLWRVRRKSERGFNDGYHLQHGEEAKALVELLNRLDRERDEARDQAQRLRVQLNHYSQVNEMAEQAFRERDEARELADRYRVAFCSAKGDLVPTPFPWEGAK